MQSTGQASTQAVSFVPMQGSAITYAIAVVVPSTIGIAQRGRKYKPCSGQCRRAHVKVSEMRVKVRIKSRAGPRARVQSAARLPAGCKERVAAVVGPRGYLDRPEDLAIYEYDGSVDKHAPDLVVFPRSTAEVSALVKIARE